jgi:hypothetical protein
MPRLEDQHSIAGRQCVDECGFRRASPRSWKDDDRTPRLEDFLQAFKDFSGQRCELRAAVVDHRLIHGPQDTIWNVGWTGNLKKVAACMVHDPESLL